MPPSSKDLIAQKTQWTPLSERRGWTSWEPWRQIVLVADEEIALKKKPSLKEFYFFASIAIILTFVLFFKTFEESFSAALIMFFIAASLMFACIGLIALFRKKELLIIDKQKNIIECDTVNELWEVSIDEIYAIQIIENVLFASDPVDERKYYEINAVFNDAERISLDEISGKIDKTRQLATSVADYLKLPLWDATETSKS